MNYQTLIDLIKQECHRQNLSVYRLSRISGIPTSTIYGIFRDNNKAQIDTICQLLDALGLQMTIEPKESKASGFSNKLSVLQVSGLSPEQKKVLEKLVGWLEK